MMSKKELYNSNFKTHLSASLLASFLFFGRAKQCASLFVVALLLFSRSVSREVLESFLVALSRAARCVMVHARQILMPFERKEGVFERLFFVVFWRFFLYAHDTCVRKKKQNLSHTRAMMNGASRRVSLSYSIDRLANEDEKCLASSRCKTAVNNTIAVTRRRECARDTFSWAFAVTRDESEHTRTKKVIFIHV